MAVSRRKAKKVREIEAKVTPPISADVESGAFHVQTDRLISFQVHGLPIAQGSTRAFLVKGRPIITSTSKGLSSWRRIIADVAQQHAPEQLWDGPVGVNLHFGLPKPKSAPKTRRIWPDKRPDLDKLTRAVLDALTYVVFSDDSQVVEIQASKDYGPPGVVVEIRKISESDGSSDPV